MAATPKLNPNFPLQHRDSWWNMVECGGRAVRGFGTGKIRTKLVMNCTVSDECRIYGGCRTDNVSDGGRKNDELVEMMKEAWPYFQAYRGRTFVVVLCAEVIESTNLGAILEDISLLHGLGIKFVLVPESHVQIDKLLAEKGCEPKYVGKYRVTDPDSLKAAMDSAGRICVMIEAKLSARPSLYSTLRHGDKSRWHDNVTVTTGNFLAAKKRGVVKGIDYGATGEVKKIDVACIRQRLESDSIVILSNIGYSSSGDVLNCNTYEVATACALALEAEKLICIINGPILDETGRLIRFLTLEDAEKLILKQSEIASIYSTFQNGVGFDFDHENGFAIGGQEGSNGYLSPLAAAAFVCRGGVERVHLVDGNIGGVVLKELYQKDGVGTMVASQKTSAKVTNLSAITRVLKPLEDSGTFIDEETTTIHNYLNM